MRFLLLLLAALTLAPPNAWAMQCDEEAFTEESSRENIDTADFIFSGKVVEVSPPPFLGDNLPEELFERYPPSGNPYFAKITYRIDKLYKGKEGTKTITAYDGWVGMALNEENRESKNFLKEYPDIVNNGERKIFYAYDFGHLMPLNITNEPFYTIPWLCFHVDQKQEEQIKYGTYKFTKNGKKHSIFEPDQPEESEKFDNIQSLKAWMEKNRPKAEMKTIDFKGEEVISLYEYNPGPIENYGGSDIQKYFLALYHRQKSGSYKRIGEYEPTIKTTGASISIEGDIMRMTADDGGKKQYVDYAISDLLGQSCQKDEHCLDGYYCLKNDYFKPRGLCSPRTPAGIPANAGNQ